MSNKLPIILQATQNEAVRRAGEAGAAALLAVHGPAGARRKLA